MCSQEALVFASCDDINVKRHTTTYHPTLWGNRFLAFAARAPTTDAKTVQELEELKRQIKNTTTKDNNLLKKLRYIDDVQRLGIAYHLENQIQQLLEKLYNNGDFNDDNDLYFTSLKFRLLRQQGYHVPSVVFKRFMDEQGRFKESLAEDVHGMLSLYEASNLAIHGEPILDEALAFTTAHLQSMVDDGHQLGDQICHALFRPIRRNLPRLEALYCINLYSGDESKDQVLLKFAKLDFNMLQLQHQGELSSITQWWANIDVKKNFPYARDRLVECYFWIMGVYFEPHYSFARRTLTKVIAMASILDDTYDAYATYQELVLLTDAIQIWDINKIDNLPDYMKLIYHSLLDVFNEAKEEISHEGRSHCVDYAIQQVKRLVKSYCMEAKWCNEGYAPTFEEYLETALVTTCYPMLAVTSFLGMGKIADQEVFEWCSNNDPKIIKASTIICRLMDDIVSHKFEQKRQHVLSGIECYIKQYGVSEEEAIELFKTKISNAWKDVNEEFMKPTGVPAPILMRVLNLSRVMDVLYKEDDGYTNSHVIRDSIEAMLLKPFLV